MSSIAILALAFTALVTLWLRGTFGGDFQRSLPNGYGIGGDPSFTVISARHNPSTVVGVQVDRVAVVGSLVVGHNAKATDPDFQGPSPVGYFILNTLTDSALTGMTEPEWLSALAARGIPRPPRLKSPRHLLW